VEQILRDGTVRRGFVGIGVGDFGEAEARDLGYQGLAHMLSKLGISEARGALVTNVYADFPGEKAGVLVGDVVTQLNGQPVKDSAELVFKVGKTRPGDTVALRILRAGRTEKTFELKVAEKPGDGTYLKPARR
jgi:S1-C subfamily serine protease